MANEHIRIDLYNLLLLDNTQANVSSVECDILLNPIYSTEQDVLGMIFLDGEGTQYYAQARSLIFNASIDIDNLLNLYSMTLNLTDKQIFIIKRDYVNCYATYQLANLINLDATKSKSKSKFLGDVKVSFNYEQNPAYLDSLIADAKMCYDSIKQMLLDWNASTDAISTFVKGSENINNNASSREWWRWLPTQQVPFAAVKHQLGNTTHIGKIGASAAYYGGYGNSGYNNNV